jgi:predicted RNA-binding Zn-ribbon protein involved in translation (DUF1610 family)
MKKPGKCVVTLEQVLAAVEADDNLGFCLACGAEAYCVEPDAREYECESCGEPKVYGAEECLLMGVGE